MYEGCQNLPPHAWTNSSDSPSESLKCGTDLSLIVSLIFEKDLQFLKVKRNKLNSMLILSESMVLTDALRIFIILRKLI